MRVYILGADGQVGHELCGIIGCYADVIPATESDFDMTDSDALRERVRAAAPDVIINAAAYTDVDAAEANPELAMRVNADAVAVLGQEASSARIGLIQYSTDFVFDGKKTTAYVETDPTGPLNQYGRSKLRGEEVLTEMDAPAIILRTAWVYSLRKKSFVSTILRIARECGEMRVVADQVGSPTFCRDLAYATALMLFGMRAAPRDQIREAKGIYHLAGTGACTRFELAKAAVDSDPRSYEHRVQCMQPISSERYPLPAIRPAYSPLDCGRFWDRFGIRLPPWEKSLIRALSR